MTALTLIATVGLTGCEDLPPDSYVPQYVIEGYMIVDEPIANIRVMRSQSVTDTFHLDASAVKDADVRIIVDGRSLKLDYQADSTGTGYYYYADTTEKVAPNTNYRLEVRTTDGSLMTGETRTPDRISWVRAPKSTLQYPTDTLNLPSPDSLSLAWTRSGSVVEYLVSVRCLDTLDYGKYLESPSEMNRRIERSFEENTPNYDDVTRWGFIPNLETNVVWVAFKWFGRQEVTIWAPDQNFMRWWKMTHWTGNPEVDPLQTSIKGGIGVFGSAAVARAETFVLKNQP